MMHVRSLPLPRYDDVKPRAFQHCERRAVASYNSDRVSLSVSSAHGHCPLSILAFALCPWCVELWGA